MSTTADVKDYYNTYDPSKGYTDILFRAGKVLQSKEVNELQSMLENQIKNVGNSILSNGDIVEGCQLIIDTEAMTAMITAGKIYLDGDVRTVSSATTLSISCEGTEIIGAKLEEQVVTPDDDESLLDIATGYDNYNLEGAYRLKKNLKLVLNDSEATTIYTIVDGVQLTQTVTEDLSQLEKVNATLAKRTYDESGNYKVEGLTIEDREYNTDDSIYVTLTSGRAYVKGYEVAKTTSTAIALPRPTTVRGISAEPKIMREGVKSYKLNQQFPDEITKVVATLQVNNISMVRGMIAGGIDDIPSQYQPVNQVLKVYDTNRTYVENQDYIVNGEGIDWSPAGNEPSSGSTYYINIYYNKTLTKDTDYMMTDYASDTDYSNLFLTGNSTPVTGSSILVSYNYALPRRDVISVDKDGYIVVTAGQPDILRNVQSPSVSAATYLIIGSVLVKPRHDDISIINNDTKAISMLDLYNMLDRITALELNQAISDLDNEAAEGEDATELMGILTDGFLGYTKVDISHPDAIDKTTIDPDNTCLALPYDVYLRDLEPDTATGYNARIWSSLITNQASEVNILSQPTATGVMQINSYNVFPVTPVITLSPSLDSWIDYNYMTVNGGTTYRVVTLRRWWYHLGESWAQSEKLKWQSYGVADGGASLGWGSTTTTKTSTTQSVYYNTIYYMRERTVNLYGYNFFPGIDNIVVRFNGVQVQMTPASSAYSGTDAGTLKANVNGYTAGSFTVPSKTPCGVKQVTAFAKSKPTNLAATNYTAYGRTATVVTTIWKTVTTLQPSDPLAQSFQLDQAQFITGVGIYFKYKASTSPITIQLRNMVNNYPGTEVCRSKVVQPSEIKVSNYGTAETRITFDEPFLCEANTQYCFTILTDDDLDSVFIGETGNTDIVTSQTITKNLYTAGCLFSSSNALTWTAHQAADLKFNLYAAKFATTGSITFKSIDFSSTPIDRLMLSVEQDVPSDCSISWQYRINYSDSNQTDWLPIEKYDDRSLDVIATKVDVRVTLTGLTNVSPTLTRDALQLSGFRDEAECVYVSRNVVVNAGFNHITCIFDACQPTDTSIVAYVAFDGTGTKWYALQGTETQKSSDYKTITCDYNLSTLTEGALSTATNYRVKLRMLRNSTNSVAEPKIQNLKNIMKTV